MEEMTARLQAACQAKGLVRFAPDQIIELLTDGETAEWIAAQLLPEGVQDAQLLDLLGEIAAAVQPPAADQADLEAAEPRVPDAAGKGETLPHEPFGADADETAGQPAAEAGAVLAGALLAGAAPVAGTDDAVPGLADLARMDPKALPPGVDPAQLQHLLASPQGELLSDFAAFCQERGANAQAEGEGMEAQLRQLQDEWLETPRQACGGKRPSELLAGGSLLPRKVETYRREEPKVQRNDPCPCGSGKKYKKCCGKAA